MSAPTKGPWRLVEADRGVHDRLRIVDAAGDVLLLIDPDDTREVEGGMIVEVASPQLRANARLIAAAPELLEALRALAAIPIETFRGGNGPGTADQNTIHAWGAGESYREITIGHVRAARAAIAKATGP